MQIVRTIALLVMVVGQSLGQQTTIDLARQGRNADFSNLSFTRPATVGSTLPVACTVGQMFFSTAAAQGQNLYLCSAVNVWTVIGNYTLTQAGLGVLGGIKVSNSSGLLVGTDGTLTANVGSSAGTLAAGNDTRLQGALQAGNNLADLSNASSALANLGGLTRVQAAASAPVQSVAGKTGNVILVHSDITDFATAVPATIPVGTYDPFGAAAAVAAASLSNSLLTTPGDLIVQGAGGAQRLAAGAFGYALLANGPGTLPTWQAIPTTYLASGASAVSRPLSAKLGDVVSVIDYGADPTGTIDSTNAIKAAFAAAPNGKIYFPAAHSTPGYYRVSSSLVVKRTQLLVGDEANSSYLYCAQTSSPCLVIADANLTWAHGGIRDLGLIGPGASGNTSVGLWLGGDPAGAIAPSNAYADFLEFHNIRIYGFNVGVQFGNNAYDDNFFDALILNGGTGVLYPLGLVKPGELAMTFFGGSIANNSTAGITNNGAGEISLHGTAVDDNGVGVTGSNVWLQAFGCHFEQTNGALISISGGTRVNLEGNTYLYTGSTGTDAAMIAFSNSAIQANITGGDANSSHPVTQFINAPNALSYNMHVGTGMGMGTNILSLINPATAPGLVTESGGVLSASTPATGDTSNRVATTAFVAAALGNAPASAGPFSLTGQTGSSPVTPGAGKDTFFFNSANNVPEALDASGNLYAMPPASILTAPANGFYAGPVSGTTGAANWRPLTSADVEPVYSALIAATPSSSLSDGPSLAKSTSPNTFTSPQTFEGPITTNNAGNIAMPAYGAQALFLNGNYQLDLMQGLDFPGLFAFSTENYGYYQAGFYNTTNTAFQGVTPGTAKSVFGFSTAGAVMSFSGNFPNPTPRNLLDDGSGNASVSGQLQVKGFATNLNVVTSAYTTVSTDRTVIAGSATSTAFTVTLVNTPKAGTIQEITNESGKVITIAVSSGVSLAGTANGTLTLAAAAPAAPTKIILQYDGSSAWHVI